MSDRVAIFYHADGSVRAIFAERLALKEEIAEAETRIADA